MSSFAFLILNYKSTEETKKCVESIEKLEQAGHEVQIVIVDNHSEDGCILKFQEWYQDRSYIHILESKENAGFSKGNNVGYAYISTHLFVDFVVMINSDIECRQKDFLHQIEALYKETDFAVLGPDVYAYRMKIHQSPIRRNLPSIERQKEELEEQKSLLRMYHRQQQAGEQFVKGNQKKALEEKLYLFGKRTGLSQFRKGNLSHRKTYENVMVHGSAIIFSKKYIEKYNHALYPEPFYYGEEDLLFLKCKRGQDRILYSPRVKVWHSAGASATKAKGQRNTLTREIFRYENFVATKQLLIQVMQDKKYFETDIRR